VLNVHGVHYISQMDIYMSEPLVPEPSLVISQHRYLIVLSLSARQTVTHTPFFLNSGFEIDSLASS